MSRNFELWQRAVARHEWPPQPRKTDTPMENSEWLRAGAVARHEWPPQPRKTDTPMENSEWLRALDVIKKRWRMSMLFAVVVAASVTLFTFLMRPVYEPEARLEIDPPGAEIFNMQGHDSGGAAADYIETQAQNLQSDGLALEVIRALHLDQNPDFAGKKISAAAPSDGAGENALRLTPAENEALTVFKKSLTVVRDSAGRLITVSVATHDPELSAQVTNTLTRLFIERDFKTRNDAIAQSTQWLQRQLDDIRQRMDDSNRALANLEKSSGIGAIGDNQNTFSERMIELSRQLMQAQADRIQLQAYLDKLNSVQSSSLPQISSDPVVQQLTAKLAESKADLAQTLAVYGVNHPNSKKLENQVNALQLDLNAQRSAILNNLKTSYTASKAREGLMQSQMDSANKQMTVLAQYNALKKEADANTQLYAALYQKIKEAAIAAETKSSNIRIVDRARVLNIPTRPHRLQNIAFGLLAGLMGGLILAFLLEALDTRIRTPEDIRRCLGAESVSVIPVIGRSAEYALGRPGMKLLPRKAQADSPIFLLDRPSSPESEALRGIYTAVRLSWRNNGDAARVLMIASALPGEGKTMLSVNLALALAQQGSTCIVDADLRKQGVALALGVDGEHGLGDVLSGTMKLDEAFVPHVQVPGLSVLPAGTASGEPGTLIASSAMADVVERLRQRFEFVVIDSPPILPVADARSISALVDGILMIGRSGVTTRANMKRAVEMLREVRSAPVLEFVLNAAEYPAVDYSNYNYNYGYGKTV
jgi:polysaccharide biosynthesis transport protein